MPVAARIVALSAFAVAVCCGALLFAASVPVELLEAPSHSVAAGKQVGHPAVAAALNTAHTQHPTAAHPTAALHAAAKEHKLKVEAELENAEHVKAMASAAAKKAFNLALSIHTKAEKMTSDADVAVKAKNLKLAKSLHEQAHTLWLQERQALDEVSKDRAIVKQEEAAEAHAASEAATLAARMDKRLAAVNAELNDAKQEALKSQQETKQANAIKPSLLAVKKALLQAEANAKKAEMS